MSLAPSCTALSGGVRTTVRPTTTPIGGGDVMTCKCDFAGAELSTNDVDLELTSHVDLIGPPGTSGCDVVLRNKSHQTINLQDTDWGEHLGMSLALVDEKGVNAPLTALGHVQFDRFSSTFFPGVDLAPGATLKWRVDLLKSFDVLVDRQYTLSAEFFVDSRSFFGFMLAVGPRVCWHRSGKGTEVETERGHH